jgi:hypothetical protein
MYYFIYVRIQNELLHMQTDIMYLGWCSWTKHTETPHCTHAYAVTTIGAKKVRYEHTYFFFLKYFIMYFLLFIFLQKLYDNVDSCGHALDLQFKHLGVTKIVSWSIASNFRKMNESQNRRIIPSMTIYPYFDGLYFQKK